MTLVTPRLGRLCRCLLGAAGPESWPGSGDLMNASQTETAVRSALDHRRAQRTPALLGAG
jgi:hypothetical protein